MARNKITEADQYDPEPRWPALIAVLAVAGLYFALPSALIVGPRWAFPLIVILLLVPTMITHVKGSHRMNKMLGFAVSAVMTIAMIGSVILLVLALPEH